MIDGNLCLTLTPSPRSSMSLAKKVNFGSPRTKMTPPTRSAGYGISTLSSWHHDHSTSKGMLHRRCSHFSLPFFPFPPTKPRLQCFRILIIYPAFTRQYRNLRFEKARSRRFRSFQSISVPSTIYSQDFSFFLFDSACTCYGEFFFVIKSNDKIVRS